MDDLISRQAAIDAFRKDRNSTFPRIFEHVSSYNEYDLLMDIEQLINNLPSAQPERKKGKWIKMSDADGIYYCCSKCGEELYRKWSFDRDYDLFPKKESIERTNFCPNCGAEMKGEADGVDS